MANDFTSNFTRKLAEVVLEKFESLRVLSKNVNTQLLKGKFNPTTGENVDFPRPTDYISQRTSDGDISATTASSIITGKATGTVQDYITVELDFQEADQALKMGNIDRFLDSAARRIVTDLEVDFASFMMKHTALLSGTVGSPLLTWDDVAGAGAIMEASGVPMDDDWVLAVNSHTQRNLASIQRSLGSGGVSGGLVKSAQEKAIIADNFAGMKVMTATTLASYTTGTQGADRAGTIAAAAPTATYVAAKDTMTQVWNVTAFQANLEVKAGETITVTGRNRLNLSTRQPIVDDTGAEILFSGTVVADVTLGAAGEGALTVTGPAIFEAAGQYNTVDAALIVGDVVTLGGAASTLIQPNLMWHKQAFGIGSVPILKLFSTDTIATTEDGLQIRVSKGASIRENKQIVRLDLRPAFADFNPFFAGKAFGTP